ncbi:hypothetical protein L596_011832 [Steinernema carpocapsae]|uniref:Cytochrome P450 n=2 Tax=Steinernema carpocapsae TaxID=34508 RepID=A0A4U5NW32_STECR|nr:hypothetical protein L596_011832 [Steinernema carpocapsae]
MTLGVSVFVFSALIAWVSWKLFEFAKKRKKLIDFIDEIPGPARFLLSDPPISSNSTVLVNFSFQIEEWGRTYAFMKNALGVIKAWVGPVPVVFLCKAEAAKILLESTTQITKPPQYNFLKRWLGTGLLTSTGGKWHARRKMLTPAFHFNILNKFVPIFSKESKVFADQIEKQADTGVEFDLFPYVKRCALDIICETAMGAEIGSQMGKNMDYVDAVTTLSRLIWHYERLPWMWLKPIWYLTGNGYTFDAALEMTTNFTRKIISERQENFVKIDTSKPDAEEFTGKRKLAFLDLLLNMQSETKLTDEDIREEVDTFMFEGHDTTSSGIGFTIWLLAQNPECQAKVHAEVDAVFGDSDRLPTHEDLKKLSYLEQCIKEALRLLPSVPFFARILTEDYHYREITIPSGVTVVVAPVAVHRDPTYWGDDAEAFNPDHFLPENIAKRHPYSYVPFAAGPRNCIGQKFAIMEEKSVCSAFFRRYRVTTEQNIVNDRPVPELILKPSDGFKVKMYKRSVAC